MLWALISIGSYVEGAKNEALAAAKRIGPVEIDHGKTNCKTPDPIAYIEKSYAHNKKKKLKRQTKKDQSASKTQKKRSVVKKSNIAKKAVSRKKKASQ